MKVMTILGTRPEIIRLTCVIEKLDQQCDHVLVHTGQNYDVNLSEIFFRDLEVRKPDHFLGVQGNSLGEQIGKIISLTEKVIQEEKPDRILVLGDTNSSLSVILAKRLGIPIFHMEAGNRCYDDRVPEEVNRRIIDHSSDILLPYTKRSQNNLLREGIESFRIFVTGNPIFEVIQKYSSKINNSDILEKLNLEVQNYFLVTMHRAENVDIKDRLRSIMHGLDMVQKIFNIPVIISVHPHTRSRFEKFRIELNNNNIILCEPFGFIDFVSLEKNAGCVISDSGTVGGVLYIQGSKCHHS